MVGKAKTANVHHAFCMATGYCLDMSVTTACSLLDLESSKSSYNKVICILRALAYIY